MSAITEYLAEVRQTLATGLATEHAYRPALQRLLTGLLSGIRAINEPKHTAAGAVDFIVKRGEQPIGWLEAKDLGADLGKVAKSDQLARYLGAYPNLILTDYLEFRLFLSGKEVGRAAVGYLAEDKVKSTAGGQEAVEKLLRTFLAQEVYRPGKPEDLAKRMAFLARMAVEAIGRALRQEGERGQLHSQLAAFRETLLPDLSEEQFADMYAQTIAYGLFAAKCHHQASGTPDIPVGPMPLGTPDTLVGHGPDRSVRRTDDFGRWTAAQYLPPTNPFLRRLFHEVTGPDLDDDVVWVVEELVSLLRNTDMSAIVEAFAKHQQGREDPVVHFYETFLKEYNPKERKLRGVYYTPEPVVSYIVRSVDYLLKTEFDKPLGLADPGVFILDPACGTGTFLYFVIEHIHRTITEQQGAGAWPGYVREHLLQRVFGFELLMAPYTIAHLKLAQLLKEQGYDFPDDQRLGVYLTNTLEEARLKSETLVQRYISEEAEAAAEVKREKPIMVVLGNPPYAVNSANNGEWIAAKLQAYYEVDGARLEERNSKVLQDDYVKFIRFAEDRIALTGSGILAFITNNSYIDGLVHRGMRRHLLGTFPRSHVLNLHGSTIVRETTPEGLPDKNVFDIKTGVAISLWSRPKEPRESAVLYSDIWGSRERKYEELYSSDVSETTWMAVHPAKPAYLLKPTDAGSLEEYADQPRVDLLFPKWSSGVKTHRDHLVVAFDHDELARRLAAFCSTELTDDEAGSTYAPQSSSGKTVAEMRAAVRGSETCRNIVDYQYRPLDDRHLYYDDAMVDRSRRDVMQHLLGDNIALICGRAGHVVDSPVWNLVWTTDDVSDVNIFYRGGGTVFPLYLYPERGTTEEGQPRRPNLSPAFVADLAKRLGLTFIEDGRGDLVATFGPEDVFHYIYAVLHSPTYRTRYAEFLKIDFPRIPLTRDRELFRRLCGLGKELVAWHLLKATSTAGPAEARPLQTATATTTATASFPVAGDNLVEAVRYDEANGRVYINKTQYFSGIGKALYEFQVGGYQVMNKWLKDRKGRQLSYDDITHYQHVAAALANTMRLMQEIDVAIPGWPLE